MKELTIAAIILAASTGVMAVILFGVIFVLAYMVFL